MKMKIYDQLELGLTGRSPRRTTRRTAPNANASFWFARMRQIADRTIDRCHLAETIQQQFIPWPPLRHEQVADDNGAAAW
jgi:hypothetical protein